MNYLNCSATVNMRQIKKSFEYNNKEMLTLSIRYPWISIPGNHNAQNRINNQISTQVNKYYKYASDKLYSQAVDGYKDSIKNNFPFHPYEAYMEYVPTYNENCFLSLYYDRYEFTGGAHGNTIRSSDTWELCRGTNIPLYCFFSPGVDYKSFLINEITRQAETDMKLEPNIYFENYKSLISENFNPESYFMTPDGISIYYQQYEIAPYSTGIVVFNIPYSKIGWYPSC